MMALKSGAKRKINSALVGSVFDDSLSKNVDNYYVSMKI
jgi:hypothetical protein